MKIVMGIAAAVLFGIFSNAVVAASQDECAIWICLPGGFPSGCGAAKSAMKDRLEDGKPPLPPFGSCAVNPPKGSGSHMSFDWGIAAYIPAHQECSGFGHFGCRSVPESYVKGKRCYKDFESSYSDPKYCTKTVRWSEVFIEEKLAGPTYYWSMFGHF
jgi:hypothetical protein